MIVEEFEGFLKRNRGYKVFNSRDEFAGEEDMFG